MPVYNGEPFIRVALDSLLAQTFTDFELIISDNASTDETEAICREYATKDLRIHYIRQPENRGALANFKFVLDQAQGEYFMWAAADDRWESNWIQTLLPLCEKHQCLSYGMVVTIDEVGQQVANPSSGRIFNFYGNKISRRIKYFFAMPSLGKANPIYGLIPNDLIKYSHIGILGDVEYGSDMLFLFDLLSIVEIRSPQEKTRLFKRIHSGCAGNSRNESVVPDGILSKATLSLLSTIVAPFKLLFSYRRYAGFTESILFVLLIPIMAARNVLVTFYYYALRKLSRQ